MSKRMTFDTANFLREQYPEDFANMSKVIVEVSRFNLPHYRRRRKKVSQEQKTNTYRFGPDLGPILDWLDENCSEVYIGRFAENEKLNENARVQFEFTNAADAMAFKLMFS